MKKFFSRKKKYGKRRMYRKKRYTKRNYMPKVIGGADRSYVKLAYADLYQASVSASTLSTRVWHLNNVFDPDYTGAGGQPLYYDQIAAMYSRYRVFGCSISVTVAISSGSTNMYHPIVCIVPYISSPGYSTILTAMQAPRARYKIAIPGQQVIKLKAYYSVAKLYGVSRKMVDDDDVFQATTTAGPARPAYVGVYVYNADGAQSITLSSYVKLVYYTRFESRYIPAAS